MLKRGVVSIKTEKEKKKKKTHRRLGAFAVFVGLHWPSSAFVGVVRAKEGQGGQ
jgi:hypothetical protein